MEPKKVRAKDVLLALREQYGLDELTDLARASGIPRETLAGWSKRPETVVRSPGRKYLQQATEHRTTNEELAAKLDEVAGLLRSFLTLRDEGRLGQVIEAKKKKHGGIG